jgi:hypothetical protein
VRANQRRQLPPAATHRRFVDAHHIKHWANGGETALDNLVLLCRHHHRLVHEGGFGVERIVGGALQFNRPDGQPIVEHPRLPDAHANFRLHHSFYGERGQPVDAADWIIPDGALDLDLTINGLLQFEERHHP